MEDVRKIFGLNKYDGMSDPNEFIDGFRCQAIVFGWDANKQASIIPFLLASKAKRAFNLLSDDDKKLIDRVYGQLRDKCKVSTESLYNEFNNRRIRVNETYAQFAFALQELLNNSCPDLGANERKMILRNKLCEHLPEHMKSLVRFNQDKSWDELVACLENSSNNKPSGIYGNGYSNVEVKDEPAELNHVRVTSKRFEGTCYHCGIKGHKKMNCYKLRDKKSPRVVVKRMDEVVEVSRKVVVKVVVVVVGLE